MNKLKRTAALLMAAGLSLSMLAGCGTPGQDSTSASPGAEQNTTVGAAEGYTYKIATVRWNDTWPTDFLTDGVMGDLAKEADIDIEWQIYYSNDFGEQKALLFASDDLPDAFFGSCGLGDSDIVQNKEKLLELTDLINEETMPNLMKIFEEDPTMRMACTDRNEQIYSLPKKIPFRPKLNSQNYINKEWLDNLNLEMPTNYDELKEVLIAFKEQDADGDGDPNNEIPISGYKPGYGSVLLDSFDLIERGDEQKIKSGEIIFSKDETRIIRKIYLDTLEGRTPETIWFGKDVGTTRSAMSEIKEIFGSSAFGTPKPTSLIERTLRLISRTDATVLDFFAGSGTTGHAVMKLNAEDGGTRRFILCTNNENGICRDVTYERIRRVIDKEDYAASLKYYKVGYVPISDRMYYEYADELLRHIRELVELENGINFTGNEEIAIVLTDEELEIFLDDEGICKRCRKLYMGHDVLLDAQQAQALQEYNIAVNVIPDYYYKELEG